MLHLLAGVTVVSIEQYIAAPYCSQILAEAGADVIKVERPPHGDPRRSYDPVIPVGDETLSGGFASYNRGKRSVLCDLTSTDGRDRFLDLLAEADVLISNLRPGALKRAGLDPAHLRREFPRLIICEISGFGSTGGPLGDRPAFDSVIQAMSGFAGLIGASPDSEPYLAPMSSMDLLSGIWAALGIAMALLRRTTTSEGCLIDTSMYDVGVAFVERALTLHEFAAPGHLTRGRDDYSPVGMFRAADGCWLSIVIPTDQMWQRFLQAIDRPDLLADQRVATVTARAQQMKSIIVPALEAWASAGGLSADVVEERLSTAGQPVGRVQSIAEVRSDPHLAHRGIFAPVVVEGATVEHSIEHALVRMPLAFDGEVSTPGPVPRLGGRIDADEQR